MPAVDALQIRQFARRHCPLCPQFSRPGRVCTQSEFDVCVQCGSWAQCAHDAEDSEDDDTPAQLPRADGRTARSTGPARADAEHDSTSAGPAADGPPDTCDMVANAPVPPGAEVFNTYGEHLANAQLLARYGFALGGNDNDVVEFDAGDLPVPAGCTQAGVHELFRRVLAALPPHRRWDASGLVYQPDALLATAGSAPSASGDDGRGQTHGARMCVNSDGRVSHALWVYCATAAVVAHEPRLPAAHAVAAAARRLARAQLLAEGGPLDGAPDPAADDDEGGGDLPRHEGTAKADKVCPRTLLCCVFRALLARAALYLHLPAAISPSLFSRTRGGDRHGAPDMGLFSTAVEDLAFRSSRTPLRMSRVWHVRTRTRFSAWRAFALPRVLVSSRRMPRCDSPAQAYRARPRLPRACSCGPR